MEIFGQNAPLTSIEFDRLENFLKHCNGGRAMNIEEIDGFFAALIAGPEAVMPSEYMAEVFGGGVSDTYGFGSFDEAGEILKLLMRHWNTIAETLLNDEVYVPMILEDETGVARGNDWARAFIRGTFMRHQAWAELVADESKGGGCMIPVLTLYHEHDEDPQLRPNPIEAERREKIIEYMAAGLLGAYRYFRTCREADALTGWAEPVPNTGKIGRNDLCPCGSGKKYKRCCGNPAIN